MDQVEFHTGIEDPAEFVGRLLGKAYRQGARVLVTADDALQERISRYLWAGNERDFIAHVRLARCTAAQAARTPLWLAAAVQARPNEPVVVVNAGAEAPPDLQRLERLIEVVATEPEQAAAGRQRWRQYKAAGLLIKHFAAR